MLNTMKDKKIHAMFSLQSVTAFTIHPSIHSFTAHFYKIGLGDLLTDSDLILVLRNSQTLKTTYR